MRRWLELKVRIEVGEDYNPDELKVLESYFLEQQKPMKFNPYEPDNILSTRENSFMEMCHSMEESGVHDPLKMSEFMFYSKIKYYEKKYRELKSKSK